MSVIWGMHHVWQGWITPQTTVWLPTTPQTYSSAVNLDIRTRRLNHTSGVVVQGWWYRYGYGSPLFRKCYLRHGPLLTGVDHPTDDSMISNYNPDMRSYYPDFRNEEFEPCTLSVVWLSNNNDAGMDMVSHHLWVLYQLWTMFDRGGSTHIPHHDLKLHPRHAQLLPWFSE